TNLSTLVTYAALAVMFYYLTLFLQGTLGYSAAAAGVATMPGVLLLALFSSRLGGLSARYGARWLLTLGPMLMAVGVLWLSRIPSTSPAWDLSAAARTFTLPSGYVTSVLPGLLVFGLGATLMVAPLTATVMASVPVERAGVASAVNTAISDVGPQLAVAVLFVAMTQNFYGALARDAPSLDVASAAVRKEVAPLNVPGPGVAEVVRRRAGGHFAALAESILHQQLAGAAARAIHGRFVALFDGDLSPEAVLAVPPRKLRAAGLSGRKVASIRDLAAKVVDGTVPLDRIR